MKRLTFLRLLAAFAVTALAAFAADKKTSASQKHPLRGVITRVEAEASALMVKHEEIPGVMRAMTMRFKVAPDVVKTFKVGDAITGLMYRSGADWRLDDVKPASAKKR